MSGQSLRLDLASARRELAEANKRREAKKEDPLVMDAQGEVTLSNGAKAAYVVRNGVPRFQIVSNPSARGPNNAKMMALQSQRKLGKARITADGKSHRERLYDGLTPSQADNAWRRAFSHKSYKSEGARKRAMSRNKCSPCLPKNMAPDQRFLNNPTKLCYPGLNDGKAPECADRVAKYASPSPKSLAARAVSARKLKEWQQSHTTVGPDGKRHLIPNSRKKNGPGSNTTNHVANQYKPRSKRAQAGGSHEEEEEEQQGGRAVSLKTAVRLLRQYYNSKYN
jgi:hypothetical protein